jgi:hypothetical protein
MLYVIMLSIIIASAIMHNAVMMNVTAPSVFKIYKNATFSKVAWAAGELFILY